MADKRPKRPKHTKIVVPGMGKKPEEKPRADEPAGPAIFHPKPPEPPPMEEKAKPEPGQAKKLGNTIQLPDLRARKDNPRVKEIRRKRRNRRLRGIGAVVASVMLVGFFLTGLYRPTVMKGAEWLETMRIGLQGGTGLPMGFEITDYKEIEPMGNGVFAVLGEKDMAVVSSRGQELYRIQHGYGQPHMTAGNYRVCVYNRGGTSYTVEGRDRRIVSGTTDAEIIFAEMSSGGVLAMATTSRYRATLQVYTYDHTGEPQFTMPVVDETPYMARFANDDKHLALACISAEGGAPLTRIYYLHTSRADKQATIETVGAAVLDMAYVSTNRLLVVYDSFTALYDGKGSEIARYDYDGGDLVTASIQNGAVALALSSISRDRLTVVSLDASLKVNGTATTEFADGAKVLLTGRNVLLLAGYDVYAYGLDGTLINSYTSDTVGLDLVAGSEPVLLRAGSVYPLGWMLSANGIPPEQADRPAGSGGAAESTAAEGEPEEAGQDGPEEPDQPGVDGQDGEPDEGAMPGDTDPGDGEEGTDGPE